MTKNRLWYIDSLKGIGILSILAIHILGKQNIPVLQDWFYFFMISIFYFVVGIRYAGKDVGQIRIRELASKRWQSVMQPFYIYSLIIFAVDIVLLTVSFYGIETLLKDVYRTICWAGIGTLWFLPTIFLAELIFVWILNKNKTLSMFLVIAVVSLFAFRVLNIFRVDTMLCDIIIAPIMMLMKSLIAVCFMILGYGVAHLNKQKWFSNWIVIILVCVVAIILCKLGNFGDFNHLVLHSLWRWFLISALACFSVTLLFKRIVTVFENKKIWEKEWLFRLLAYFGKNSLIMMATHYSILIPLYRVLFSDAIYNEHRIVFFVITVLIEIPIIELINRKCVYVSGKRRLQKDVFYRRKNENTRE